MRVTSIAENTSSKGLPVEHGLSLFIEKNDGQKVLFDMGQSSMFAQNAKALGLSVADVNVAVISHGHYDHGGGLSTFLSQNDNAKVFVHSEAFQPHYSLRETELAYIGLDTGLEDNERLVFCRDVTVIATGMTLVSNVRGTCCYPAGNSLLFGPSKTGNDVFCHEQNLVITENDKIVLFAGCAHCGIVNILRKVSEVTGKVPTHVLAGMHLAKHTDMQDIESLADELMKYGNTKFYTMHCTGEEQFNRLKSFMGAQIEYLACGDNVTI